MGADTPTIADWIAALDVRYPTSWAEEWDNPGLQVGDRSWPAARALISLDPTREVIGEAIRRGCSLVVTHHPLVFRPLSRVDLSDPVSAVVAEAISGRVGIFACHTNADVAQPGVSDSLAETLGVEVMGVLRPTHAGARSKLVTFVPPEATTKVLDAVSAAGGGVIGEYSHCSFRVRGSGTFLPSDAANPVLGERGELNEVEEDRLEIVVPAERIEVAARAMIDAHPYEEVAYDVYPLAGGGMGLGRIGRLAESTSARGLADHCEQALGARPRLVGDPGGEVRTVALCGGSGASLIVDAIRAGADAYVTGDIKHHDAQAAEAAGLAVVDAGHAGTEAPFVRELAARLRDDGIGEVLLSETNTDPFRRR